MWKKADPPEEVRATFEPDSPTMGWAADVLATVQDCGFEVLDHFTLPDDAWWTDFYTPMEARISMLQSKYDGAAEAIQVLDSIKGEIEMHRRYSDYYAYECIVARRCD